VYPALAVAAALTTEHPETELLWAGSHAGLEREMVEGAGLSFTAVASGPLVGVNPLRTVVSAARMAWGVRQALRLVRRFRPDVLLMTGGWATVPVALACRWRRVPILIYLPDIEPAGAIKVLSRFAARVAVTTIDSAPFFRKGLVVETGYPVRPALLSAAGYDALGRPAGDPAAARREARVSFALEDGLPTLLVFGGSRGARSINRALTAILPDLLPECQVIHISGTLDWPWVSEGAAQLASERVGRYHPYPYLESERMALALAAADLVVARAGAGTLGEFPLFGLPAILVPYPHAWRYQKVNADALADRGAAVRLDDADLATGLLPLIQALLRDASRRQGMAEAARALARPDAAARVAGQLTTLVQESRGQP
jgi:UDP-N-acetylglucosamine--N-acetylmuramyl-(pentapeptide) pyrophosphoryl-undecaprenol N-acetylglucosamine transferase